MESTPGKNFIKVSSIIMLIGGPISAISSLQGMAASAQFDRVIPIAVSWSLVYLLFLLVAVYQVFLGINGVAYCNVPEKAEKLRILGTICLVLASIVMLVNMITLSQIGAGTNAVTSIFGLTMPIIFMVGADKNYRAQTEDNQDEDQDEDQYGDY